MSRKKDWRKCILRDIDSLLDFIASGLSRANLMCETNNSERNMPFVIRKHGTSSSE